MEKDKMPLVVSCAVAAQYNIQYTRTLSTLYIVQYSKYLHFGLNVQHFCM